MTITASTLTRAAAVALAVAGVIFIAIQPLHPPEALASITTATWVAVHLASVLMAVLGLAGITAIYLGQIKASGLFGLGAYLLFSLYFLLQAAYTFVEAFVLPLTAAGSPELTLDLASLFTVGHVAQTDLGALAVVGSIGAVLYLGGGVLFGITVIRGRVLPRWTGIFLIVAAVASLAAVVIPHELARYAAVPMGAALIALGVAMWLQQRQNRTGLGERRREYVDASV